MNTLSHVLEANGLATVALAANEPLTQRMHPPRALYCEFPFGRPLGRPRDAAFQRRVIDAAFALLDRAEPPVLERFPEVITDEAEMPLACPLPPRFDPGIRPVVAEARGVRAAYDRAVEANSGRTQVGRVLSADQVPDALDRLARLAEGERWTDLGFNDMWGLAHAAMDTRAYYEEAAIGLSDHVPAARAAESWLYQRTEAGDVLRRAANYLHLHPDPTLDPRVPLVLLPLAQRRDTDFEFPV